MNLTEVTGLVIKTTDLSESDRIIRLYSDKLGLVSIYANNSRSLKSRYMAATQLFCYGNFVLYEKGEHYWLREADLKENFFGLRSSIEKTALASYFCDILSECGTNIPDPSLLRLTLNSLYALEHSLVPDLKIKASFEMRAMAELGFMPDLSGCDECGSDEGDLYLDVLDGICFCRDCKEFASVSRRQGSVITEGEEIRRPIIILSPPVRLALLYVMESPIEKIFSFRIPDEASEEFYAAAEHYLLNQLGRSFETLKFYKEISV